ncbi:MAG: ribonuclease P protein component [Candidatus Dojkabacteria bacterium]
MLNKKLRLPSKDIVAIARKGKRLTGELFDVKVWYQDDLVNPLMTISISTKIDKRATVRNKIKRKIRAVWAEILKTEKVRKGKYLIIIKSSKLEILSNDLVKKSIVSAIS